MLFFSRPLFDGMKTVDKIDFLNGIFSDLSVFYSSRYMPEYYLQALFFCSLLGVIKYPVAEIQNYDGLITSILDSISHILDYSVAYANHLEIEEIATKSPAAPAA